MDSSWSALAEESHRAAKSCLELSYFRGAVNRAYFCAFQWTTCFLRQINRVEPPKDRECWRHTTLPRILEKNFKTKRSGVRRDLANALKELYRLRLLADYSARYAMDEKFAKDALRDAEFVRRMMMKESGYDQGSSS